jgi:hypothetical protein
MQSRLSVAKLRALVRKEADRRRSTSNRGRPRTPEVIKAIDSCLRSLRNEETSKLRFSRSDLAKLNEEQHARVGQALELLEKRVAELRRIVG